MGISIDQIRNPATRQRIERALALESGSCPASGNLQSQTGVSTAAASPVPVEREIPLHNRIIAWCNSQWPKWKYIHANPSQRSSIQVGAPDFPIVYLPGGKFIIGEIKTADGKMSADQLSFKKELEMIGHKPQVWRSFEDFIHAAEAAMNDNAKETKPGEPCGPPGPHQP